MVNRSNDLRSDHSEGLKTTASNLSTTLRSMTSGGFRFREHQVIGRDANPRHDHDYQCMGFLIAGLGTAEFGREEWTVRPGYINVIPSGIAHVERFGTPEIRWCGIELPTVGDECEAEAKRAFDRPLQLRGGPANRIAALIYHELRLADDASVPALHALGLELLTVLAERLPRRELNRPKWIARAEELLRTQFLAPPSLSEMASEIGVHPMHLAREFRRFFGVSVGEFIRDLRVDFAITLLTDEDIPLARVGFAAGFADQAHFTRVFRRRIGVTPGAYRSSHRK